MKLSFFVLSNLLLISSSLVAQVPESSVRAGALTQAQEALDALERTIDPMHMSLVDPLDALADQFMIAGRYDQAHRTLDRAVQIVRINEGLYTRSQVPLQRKKIQNLANSGNWEDARQQLEYLYWLHTKKSKYVTLQLLNDFNQLSDLHLRGISEDFLEHQAFHFKRAANINWMSLAIAQALWGEQDPRLVPVIYRVINQLNLERIAVNVPGLLSRSLRVIAPNSDWLRDVEQMNVFYHEAGKRLLGQISSIYAFMEPPNSEAVAMAQLYLADWDALFKQNNEALETYKVAYANLVDVTQDPEAVNGFLETPRLLPEPDFYDSLDSAMRDSVSANSLAVDLEIELDDPLVFSEWSAAFPFVQQPRALPKQQNDISEFAIFSFNLEGVPDIARFLRFRNPAGIGVVENLSLLEPNEPGELNVNRLSRHVKTLRFRPKLVEGVPHEMDATLVYLPASVY